MGSIAYNRDHVRQIKFNFNLKTDADILSYLDAVDNKQGYIKALIRADIASRAAQQEQPEQRTE